MNFVDVTTPVGLSSTYSFVLPQNNGVQNQILSLNSSLETEWVDNTPNNITNSIVTYTNTNVNNYITINSMSLTPSSGIYYCVFNSSLDVSRRNILDYAFFV